MGTWESIAKSLWLLMSWGTFRSGIEEWSRQSGQRRRPDRAGRLGRELVSALWPRHWAASLATFCRPLAGHTDDAAR